jgi:hypothetical protein
MIEGPDNVVELQVPVRAMSGSHRFVMFQRGLKGFQQFGLLLFRSGQIIKPEGENAVSP